MNDAQRRARVALFVTTVATGTILAGLWNLYGSWDSQWAQGDEPKPWATEQLQIQEVRSWVDNNTVGIPLVGLKLSTSDAAITGSVLLLVLSLYQLVCFKRENEEVGSLLVDTQSKRRPLRTAILQRVAPLMLTADGRQPFVSLGRRPPRATISGLRFGVWILTYQPAIGAAVILVSDLYYAFIYVAPYKLNPTVGAWNGLGSVARWQLGLMDASAAIMIIVTGYFCHFATNYRTATRNIIQQYEELRERSEAQTEA